MRLTGPDQERPAPAACSACFQAKPLAEHVDFEAAWDGPRFKDGVMGEGGQVLEGISVAIDDLVLCGECIRTAAALLPEDEAEEARQVAVRAELSHLHEDAAKREAYIEKLEAAVEAKGELREARSRRRRR